MWKLVKRLVALLVVIVIALAAAGYYWLSQELPAKPALQGELIAGSIEMDGRQRSWKVYVPRTRVTAPALIVVLHGSMGSPDTARVEDFGYDFDRIADRHGALVVYPQGVGGHWNNAARVGPYSAKKLDIDDGAFLHALVERLVSTYGAARDQVVVTGVSNGGAMVTRLAMQTPDFARAYAVVSENIPTPENLAMSDRKEPVSILFLNGTDDPIVPWNGGEVVLWPVLASRGEVRSVEESITYFRHLAGVQTPPAFDEVPDADTSDGTHATRRTWVGTGGHRVVQITLHGGGHGAPHPEKRGMRLLGRGNRDFHAAEAIWEFFQSTSTRSAVTSP